MEETYQRADETVDRFDTNPEASYTIPARMYFDPQTLEEERRSIFWRSWIYVGHVCELRQASQYVTADIAGQRIYVIRGQDDVLRGFFNVCQHRGHSLLKGKGKAKNVIVCPYHAWSYDARGALVAAPNCENVAGFDKKDFSLSAIKVEDFCGFVFVNLDPDALPMAEVFPGAEEALRSLVPQSELFESARDIPFEIKGNWKNVGDNLLECYHCATGHRDFVDLVDMSTYQIETHEYWSLQLGGCRPSNTAYNFAPEAKGDDTFATLYLWPTLAFAKFPGMPGISTFWFQPTAPKSPSKISSITAQPAS